MIKCIHCGKEASYIFLGNSFCEKCLTDEIAEIVRQGSLELRELMGAIKSIRHLRVG